MLRRYIETWNHLPEEQDLCLLDLSLWEACWSSSFIDLCGDVILQLFKLTISDVINVGTFEEGTHLVGILLNIM